ncbi:MAG: Bbp16 family capsid cement protein [Pigmentiphaga sp.]
MYIDSRLELSNKQVLAGSGASTNVVDVGVPARKLGPGQPMYVIVQTDATAGADVTVTVQTDTVENFASPTAIAAVTIPDTTPAGTRFVVGFPFMNERYVRLSYSAAITASAWLTSQEPQSWEPYPAQT